MMERVATLVTFLLGLSFLLHAVQGQELPPCSQVPGGIPGWDCWPPAKEHYVDTFGEDVKSKTDLRSSKVFGELPPCSQVPGGIPGWDCYDPPTHPLPPCDFKHQRIGFDCSGWPPAKKQSVDAVGEEMKSKTNLGSSKAFGELPPCNEVPGGIPGWDCYDPPNHPLPPCDFKHQRIGFDCSGWPPAKK